MKFLINLILLTLMLGIGALFVLKQSDGSPWISLEDVQPDVDSAGFMARMQETLQQAQQASEQFQQAFDNQQQVIEDIQIIEDIQVIEDIQ